MLDIEVAGAVAPGARIAVYFAPNTDQGFLRAINRAVHDKVNQPSVISISWGGPEASWTDQSLNAFDQAFQAASLLGVTICVASGDGGSTDGVPGRLAHVDFPASSPNVLACGERALSRATARSSTRRFGTMDSRAAQAVGESVISSRPAWQQAVGVPASINPWGGRGRGVPDVSGNADENTGYKARVDGINTVIGGTSAVAPLWAGLIALMNEKLGTAVGYLNPLLYRSVGSGGALRDIKIGNNDMTGLLGGYVAGDGWDACTGFGSPDGDALLLALQGSAVPHVSPKKATKVRKQGGVSHAKKSTGRSKK